VWTLSRLEIPDEIARWFATRNATPNSRQRYNVAPTQDILAVRFNPETKERILDALRWGLVPYWAKDIKIGYSLINAKAETVAEKPAFREAFKSRRCLIAADGFYEWKKLDAKTKQPYAITMKDRSVFGFAGLWERWKDKARARWCAHARSSQPRPMWWLRQSMTGCR
jgi:putative SOS response-associated peptidase YedK